MSAHPEGLVSYLVERFRNEYPDANITEVKVVDLVLWQTRPNKARHLTARKRNTRQ
jgi:hypothetical protein